MEQLNRCGVGSYFISNANEYYVAGERKFLDIVLLLLLLLLQNHWQFSPPS